MYDHYIALDWAKNKGSGDEEIFKEEVLNRALHFVYIG